MDFLSDKVWAVLTAIISTLGGFIIYERRQIENRFVKIEKDISENQIDVAVFKESLENLKEDTQEIKRSQQNIIDLLVKKRKL